MNRDRFATALTHMRSYSTGALEAEERGYENTTKDCHEAMIAWALVAIVELLAVPQSPSPVQPLGDDDG